MEAKRFSGFNPYFAIIVAIPVLVACFYLIQFIEFMKAHFPGWLAMNCGWLILAGILLCAPMYWKAYKKVCKLRDDRADRHAHRAILLVAAEQARHGANLRYRNEKTGDMLELSPSDYEIVEESQVSEEQIEGPQTVPSVIRYEDIASQVPNDKSLLGVHPGTSQLEIVPPDQLKTVWFVGGSNTGKTNTVFGKVGDCVRWGCKVSICDQHAFKRDSLAGKLGPYRHAFLHNPAMSDDEIKDSILGFLGEFHRRRNGGTYTDKLLIVVDEVNGLCEHVVRVSKQDAELIYERYGVEIKKERIKMRVFIQLLVETCGYESRGFDMFGFFISQKAADLFWLRKAAMTVFVHGLLMKSEAMLACNDNAVAADLVTHFKKGRTYIYGYEVERPMELQQPLYSVISPSIHPSTPTTGPLQARIVDEVAPEVAIEVVEVEPLTDAEKRIGEMFFSQELGASAIAKQLYPDISGGAAYQRVANEINGAIRKYGRVAMAGR